MPGGGDGSSPTIRTIQELEAEGLESYIDSYGDFQVELGRGHLTMGFQKTQRGYPAQYLISIQPNPEYALEPSDRTAQLLLVAQVAAEQALASKAAWLSNGSSNTPTGLDQALTEGQVNTCLQAVERALVMATKILDTEKDHGRTSHASRIRHENDNTKAEHRDGPTFQAMR